MSSPSTTRAYLERSLRELHEASWGWALSCCGRNHADAEEVLQRTYVKVLEGKASYGGDSSFRTWLLGVIRLTALEHRRWSLVRSLWAPLTGGEPSSRRGQDDTLADHEHHAMLVEALAEVSERQRQVLHLVFYQDMSIAEAAVVMGVSLGSARQHYERGKSSLAAALARRGLEVP